MALPTSDNLFGYNANEILPIVATVLIAVSTAWHAYQNK